MDTESPRNYRIGIDVGSNSVGLAAIEVDHAGAPVEILSMETIIHDGGVDPTANKTAGTRKAVSGVARRMRRLVRRRRQRLLMLDETLQSLGWPIVDLDTIRDPFSVGAGSGVAVRCAALRMTRMGRPGLFTVVCTGLATRAFRV